MYNRQNFVTDLVTQTSCRVVIKIKQNYIQKMIEKVLTTKNTPIILKFKYLKHHKQKKNFWDTQRWAIVEN